MEKLNVDTLFSGENEYEAAKKKYIAKYTEYESGYSTGIFGWKSGEEVHKPDVGAAKWDSYYPLGYESWRENAFTVTYSDLKVVEAKINEIIEHLTTHS